VTKDRASLEEPTEVDEAVDAEKAKETKEVAAASGRRKRAVAVLKKRPSGKILAAVLTLLVVASLGVLGGVFYSVYLPDRDTDAAAAKTVLSTASEGAVAILSYSPETIDRDVASAKSRLTGNFLKYYSQFTDQIVGPAAKQKSVKQTAIVLRSALSELHPDTADVLLFVNESTQSKDRPEPTFQNSSVLVRLTKVDGKWLISEFTPV
jgi:Mce-associated membrane protein